MIALFFGLNGRLGVVCRSALLSAFPNITIVSFNRNNEFCVHNSTIKKFTKIDQFMRICAEKECLIFDCSIDHSSTLAMYKHESIKRALIIDLVNKNVVKKYIGFSSGITFFSDDDISLKYQHMTHYREVKLSQEKFVISLNVPVFLPNIFTLIGKETFIRKASAWASIFMDRINGKSDCVINDPFQMRSWVSEDSVCKALVRFLSVESSPSVFGALTDGLFSLDKITSLPINNLPALSYKQGRADNWLVKDYCHTEGVLNDYELSLALSACQASIKN